MIKIRKEGEKIPVGLSITPLGTGRGWTFHARLKNMGFRLRFLGFKSKRKPWNILAPSIQIRG